MLVNIRDAKTHFSKLINQALKGDEIIIASKKSIGRLTLPHNLLEAVASEGFKILPILAEECLGVADLPLLHSDPFDRLLIIQAKLHDLVFITNDSKIAEYPPIHVKA